MNAPSSVLDRLLAGAGIDSSAELMRWMVLTWDLADIGETADNFIRVFLTPTMTVAAQGQRSQNHFDALNPVIGNTRTMDAGDDPLIAAERVTNNALKFGFRLVCRPLAVDCSSLAGVELADGFRFSDPGDLMDSLADGLSPGTLVLRTINDVRLAAVDTHLAPGWWDAFGLERDKLWEGRR